jgi:hypothetical protein
MEGLTTKRTVVAGMCKGEANFGEHKPMQNENKGHGTTLGGRVFTFRSSVSTPRRHPVTRDGNRGRVVWWHCGRGREKGAVFLAL